MGALPPNLPAKCPLVQSALNTCCEPHSFICHPHIQLPSGSLFFRRLPSSQIPPWLCCPLPAPQPQSCPFDSKQVERAVADLGHFPRRWFPRCSVPHLSVGLAFFTWLRGLLAGPPTALMFLTPVDSSLHCAWLLSRIRRCTTPTLHSCWNIIFPRLLPWRSPGLNLWLPSLNLLGYLSPVPVFSITLQLGVTFKLYDPQACTFQSFISHLVAPFGCVTNPSHSLCQKIKKTAHCWSPSGPVLLGEHLPSWTSQKFRGCARFLHLRPK